MKSFTLCSHAGIFLCSLLFFVNSKAQVVTVASGNWNSTSTWSSGSLPGPGDDVIIRHTVSISNTAFNATVNSLTLENTGNVNAELSFNSGTAVRSLHIINDLVVTATTNNNCRFYLQGSNTSTEIDGDIILTRDHTGFVDAFGVHLRSGSTITANNLEMHYNNSGDDHQEVYVRETSSLILAGDISVVNAGGVEEPSIDVVDDAYLECNNFTMLLTLPEAPSGVGRDAELRVWENGSAVVHGNFLARRTGGRRINITIGNSSLATASLTIEGNMVLEHFDGLNHTNKDMPVEVTGQCTLTVLGNVTAHSTSARALTFQFLSNSQFDVNGDVTLTGTTNTNLTMNAYHTSQIFFGGDIIMNYPSSPNYSAFYFSYSSPNFSTVTFDGSANQTVPAETYGNLVINNSSYVTLQGNITVNNHLNLANGKVVAATRMVTLPVAATIAGSSASYICNGTLRRTIATGAGPYWFYVGDTARGYSPVTLSNISADTRFDVTYYPVSGSLAPSPGPYSPTVKSPTLNRVSNREYWMIDRTSGTGSAQVALGWNNNSIISGSGLDDLRIAHWEGGLWTNTGPTIYSGNDTEGMIRTVTDITSFSPFTLASVSPDHFFILPAAMFKTLYATRQQDKVMLRWETRAEPGAGDMIVERSEDGIHFEHVGTIAVSMDGKINQAYTWYDDEPIACKSWYRISWHSASGEIAYSNTAQVNILPPQAANLYPNPVSVNTSQYITITLPDCGKEEYFVQVTDLAGKQLHFARIRSGTKNYKIPVMNTLYPKGMYLVQLRYSGGSTTTRFLVQ